MKTKSYTGWLALATLGAAVLMLQIAARDERRAASAERNSTGSAAQSIAGQQRPIAGGLVMSHQRLRAE